MHLNGSDCSFGGMYSFSGLSVSEFPEITRPPISMPITKMKRIAKGIGRMSFAIPLISISSFVAISGPFFLIDSP